MNIVLFTATVLLSCVSRSCQSYEEINQALFGADDRAAGISLPLGSPPYLFSQVEKGKIQRVVRPLTDGSGYIAVTTSDDPQVAKGLQVHVAMMKAMAEGHGNMRAWDPAFTQLYDNIDDVHTIVNNMPNGVNVTVIGRGAQAAAAACNHANTVSNFVKNGVKEAAVKHERFQPPYMCVIGDVQ